MSKRLPKALANLGLREITEEEAAAFPLHGEPEPPSVEQTEELARAVGQERAFGMHPAFRTPVVEGGLAMAMPVVVPRLVETQRGTVHLAAQAVSHLGVRGPFLSAEGCNLDDAIAEFELHEPPEGADWCKVCAAPYMKED